MPKATVFMHDEAPHLAVLDLDEDSGLGEDGEPYPLGEMLHDVTGLDVIEASVASEWALMAACWALQQIATAGDADAVRLKRIAQRALGEVTLGGDLEEHTVEVYDEPGYRDGDPLFGIAPIERRHGTAGSPTGVYRFEGEPWSGEERDA